MCSPPSFFHLFSPRSRSLSVGTKQLERQQKRANSKIKSIKILFVFTRWARLSYFNWTYFFQDEIVSGNWKILDSHFPQFLIVILAILKIFNFWKLQSYILFVTNISYINYEKYRYFFLLSSYFLRIKKKN